MSILIHVGSRLDMEGIPLQLYCQHKDKSISMLVRAVEGGLVDVDDLILNLKGIKKAYELAFPEG